MFAAIVAAASGCAQPMHRAADLPLEYAAPPSARLDTLNLTRLAGSAHASDVIAWGDLLAVEVDAGIASIPPRSLQIRVAKDGTVGVPLVGRVGVAGMEVERAEQEIAAAARARDVFPNAFISVRIAEPRANYVTVVGAVETPGVYPLPRGTSSVLAALVAAGGLSKSACGEVEIRHTDPRLIAPGVLRASGPNGTTLAAYETAATDQVIHVNLLTAAGSDGRRMLEDGDVVNVVKRDLPPIHVMGLVNHPGAFEINTNHETRLLDGLALAGGCSSQVADRVVVIRRLPGMDSPVTIQASIQKAIEGPDNLLLAPGDTIVIRQTPETVLVDVIRNFVRIGIGGTVALF